MICFSVPLTPSIWNLGTPPPNPKQLIIPVDTLLKWTSARVATILSVNLGASIFNPAVKAPPPKLLNINPSSASKVMICFSVPLTPSIWNLGTPPPNPTIFNSPVFTPNAPLHSIPDVGTDNPYG